jgi:hypothetical protein
MSKVNEMVIVISQWTAYLLNAKRIGYFTIKVINDNNPYKIFYI